MFFELISICFWSLFSDLVNWRLYNNVYVQTMGLSLSLIREPCPSQQRLVEVHVSFTLPYFNLKANRHMKTENELLLVPSVRVVWSSFFSWRVKLSSILPCFSGRIQNQWTTKKRNPTKQRNRGFIEYFRYWKFRVLSENVRESGLNCQSSPSVESLPPPHRRGHNDVSHY